MTVFVLRTDGDRARLGIAATRKIGSSVDRNRAKRLAREVFRRYKMAAGADIVIVPRREMLDAPFASLEADYHAALQRSGRDSSQPSRPRRPPRSRTAQSV